jgi:hypothetical protein
MHRLGFLVALAACMDPGTMPDDPGVVPVPRRQRHRAETLLTATSR